MDEVKSHFICLAAQCVYCIWLTALIGLSVSVVQGSNISISWEARCLSQWDHSSDVWHVKLTSRHISTYEGFWDELAKIQSYKSLSLVNCSILNSLFTIMQHKNVFYIHQKATFCSSLIKPVKSIFMFLIRVPCIISLDINITKLLLKKLRGKINQHQHQTELHRKKTIVFMEAIFFQQ